MKHSMFMFRTSSAARQHFATDRFHKPCSGGSEECSVAPPTAVRESDKASPKPGRRQATSSSGRSAYQTRNVQVRFKESSSAEDTLLPPRRRAYRCANHPILCLTITTIPGTFPEYCAASPQAQPLSNLGTRKGLPITTRSATGSTLPTG